MYKDQTQDQRLDLKTFFSLAINLKINNPKDSIFKYATKVLSSIDIFEANWNLFQSILFKIGISEPATLPIILKSLLKHPEWVDQNKTKDFIHSIILEHLPKVHNFEISWALWFADRVSISLNNNIAQSIFNSRDYISILTAFRFKQKGLISSTLDMSRIESQLNR